MWKKIFAMSFVLVMAFCMAACSVLPVEENGGILESIELENSTSQSGSKGMVKEKTPQEIRAAYIEDYKLRHVVSVLMQLPPIPTNAELERIEAEKRQQMPYTTAQQELIDYCRNQADIVVKEFLTDYSTEAYAGNETKRTLKKIYDGQTGREINGGAEALTIGYETGYWRVTDCSYYNTVFYTDGEVNSVRLLYRCNLYHYVLEAQENLAAQRDETELTTENSKVDEYGNAFLMVTMNDVCPKDVSDTIGKSQNFKEEVLLFTDYEAAIKSIENPQHTFAALYLTNKEMKGSVVNGYIGQPIVRIPNLVGKYIDVAHPEQIKELDELGITNYVVKWVENDGSHVPYSILTCSVDAGSLVDITDMSSESKIIITVAEKVVEPVDTSMAEENTATEESPAE